jgi:two-component system, OmpR family, phosphate regulon sensor histidine kinase PhoR
VELVRRPQVVELVQRTHRGGMVDESVVAVGPQGRRQLRLRASPLQNSGRGDPLAGQERVYGVLLLVSDVSRLAKLESMRRDFTANVSHELKTPLASIQAYAETLLIGAIEDPEANRRFVQEIATQADRLHALIHDLLQLARLDSQPEAVQLGPVQLPPIVDDVLRSHEPIAAARGVRLRHAAPEVPAVVGDLESLRTVFSNLVSNAIRYNREGGEVEISYAAVGGQVELAVRDTGVGIAAEEHDRIFERFYRIDKARSIDAGGTGLGLSIVKHLVQQVGGEIRLESRPGQGTTFFVSLEKA